MSYLDWPFRQSWLDWCSEFADHRLRVKAIKEPHPIRNEIAEAASSVLGGNPRIYAGRQHPSPGDGWEFPPHQHPYHESSSIVHYLDPGGADTRFCVTDEAGNVLEEISPEPGLTFMFPNTMWHAARKHHGTSDRMFLVLVGGW